MSDQANNHIDPNLAAAMQAEQSMQNQAQVAANSEADRAEIIDPNATTAAQNITSTPDLSMDTVSQNTGSNGGSTSTTSSAQVSGKTTEPNMAEAKQKFDIPEAILKNHEELVELVLVTQSMNDEERQYWFNILPIMSEDQMEKLRQILVTEQRKLAALNQDYNERITRANEKFVLQWKEKEIERKRLDLAQKEQTHEESESEAEAALLAELDNI